MLIACGLHGAIADDDGSRFWYSNHVLAIAGDGFMSFLSWNATDQDQAKTRREGILRCVGLDSDLEAALYAVWELNSDENATMRLVRLFEYVFNALPELFPGSERTDVE